MDWWWIGGGLLVDWWWGGLVAVVVVVLLVLLGWVRGRAGRTFFQLTEERRLFGRGG